MRWGEAFEEKKKRLGRWRRWFAWYPVMVGEHWVWLEWVLCRAEWESHIYDYGWNWSFQWKIGDIK